MALCVVPAPVAAPGGGTVTALVPVDAPCPPGASLVLSTAEAAEWQQTLETTAARVQAVEQQQTTLPPPSELATAWGASFFLVVGCYVIARQVGAVVNFLK